MAYKQTPPDVKVGRVLIGIVTGFVVYPAVGIVGAFWFALIAYIGYVCFVRQQ